MVNICVVCPLLVRCKRFQYLDGDRASTVIENRPLKAREFSEKAREFDTK